MVISFHLRTRLHQLAITVALFACALWQTSMAQVEARLDRNIVPVGNGALLTLSVSGSGAGAPNIPAVENLIIQPRGQSQSYQLSNGRTSRSVTYSYAVGSNTEGDYEVPPIEVTIEGTKHVTKALKLKVIAASATAAPSRNARHSARSRTGRGRGTGHQRQTIRISNRRTAGQRPQARLCR